MIIFFFKQKTAYEMRISDWSSDLCSSDLRLGHAGDPRLRRRIIGLPRITGRADDAGDRHDPPETHLHHRLRRGAAQAKIGLEVDANDVGPLLILHTQDQLVTRYPSVVSKDVDVPQGHHRQWTIGRATRRRRGVQYG